LSFHRLLSVVWAVALAAAAAPLLVLGAAGIGSGADLTAYVTASRPPIGEAVLFRVGDRMAWQVDIVNLGPDPAGGVSFVDTLPPGFRVARLTTHFGNAVLKNYFRCTVARGKVSCSAIRPTAVNSTHSIFIVGAFTARTPAQATNEVVVSSRARDPYAGNNDVKTTVAVTSK
jgi:uncharacterized repeat protein (TIGR01451 family)